MVNQALPKIPTDIVWIGSPNYTRGRAGAKPLAIVNHIAEGTLAGVDSWFQKSADEGSGVSTHLCVGKSGEIHQYVSSWDTAYGNGRWRNPDVRVPWIAEAYRNGVNPNRLTIQIEQEGWTGDQPTRAQYLATLALHVHFCRAYGIPADREHFVGHYQIDSVNRINCPGSGFPFWRLITDVQAILG